MAVPSKDLWTTPTKPKAFEFRKRYQKDKKGFFDFFNSKECKAYGTYDETWSFIKKEKNSLHRYNNLWIF